MPLPVPPQKPSNKNFNWGRLSKTLSFWILIILIPVAFIQLAGGRSDQAPAITYTPYDEELSRDNIARVTIQAGKFVSGEFKNRVNINDHSVKKFTTRFPVENSAPEIERLRQ